MAGGLDWSLTPPASPGRYYYRDPAEMLAPQECHVEHPPDRRRPGLVARFPFAVVPLDDLAGEWAGPIDEPPQPAGGATPDCNAG